jgi:probable rRNA maturation factor
MRDIGCAGDAELEVVLTGDAMIARLNRRFLGHRGPTDVLTFPGERRLGDPVVGEVIISVERARAQAAAARWSVGREVALLLVHGVLHLGGYDDHSRRAAAAMRERERVVLAKVFRGDS